MFKSNHPTWSRLSWQHKHQGAKLLAGQWKHCRFDAVVRSLRSSDPSTTIAIRNSLLLGFKLVGLSVFHPHYLATATDCFVAMYYSGSVRPRPLYIFGAMTGLFVISYLLFGTSQLTSMLDTPSFHPHYYSPVVPPSVLLVSAFYPLANSKHSHADYNAWLKGFLGTVETHIYFFTSPAMVPTIKSIRGNLPITFNTTFENAFSIPPLRGLEARYEKMHAMDPEKEIHNHHLYAVWNSKGYLLDQGIKNSLNAGHNYDYAFWNDAGSFRDHQEFSDWPNAMRISQIFNEGTELTGTPKEDLFFQPIWDGPGDKLKNWKESDGPVDVGNSYSEGELIFTVLSR